MSEVRDMIIDRCLRKRALCKQAGFWDKVGGAISDARVAVGGLLNDVSDYFTEKKSPYNPTTRQKLMDNERSLHRQMGVLAEKGVENGMFGNYTLNNVTRQIRYNNTVADYEKNLAEIPEADRAQYTQGLERRMGAMGSKYYSYTNDRVKAMHNLTDVNLATQPKPGEDVPLPTSTGKAIKSGIQSSFLNTAMDHIKQNPLENTGASLYYIMKNKGVDLPWLNSKYTGYVAAGAAALGGLGLAAYAFGGGGGGGSERGDDGDDDYDRSNRFAHNTSWWPSGLPRTTNYARAAQMRG